MSKYTDLVKDDTPRVIVAFRRDDQGNCGFQWGINPGSMDPISLIGYINRVQNQLQEKDARSLFDNFQTDKPEFCIAYLHGRDHEGREHGQFCWFLNPDIPIDPLVGMLEIIKETLVGSRVAQIVRNQQMGLAVAKGPSGLVGPDGAPWRGG